MKKRFQSKSALREARNLIEQADKALQSIRDHFNCDWEENAYCELDVSLSQAKKDLQDATSELGIILNRFGDKPIRPDFPPRRSS